MVDSVPVHKQIITMNTYRDLMYQTVHLQKLIDNGISNAELSSVAQQWVNKVARLSERLAESEDFVEALEKQSVATVHLTRAVNKIMGEIEVCNKWRDTDCL